MAERFPAIGPNDPCACQSGLRACICCRRADGTFWKQPTAIPRRAIEHRNIQCYLRGLGDCDADLSAEHWLPRPIIERIGGEFENYKLDRLKRPKRIGPSSAVTNVLCRHHNSALHQLDEVGTQFFNYTLDACSGVDCPDAILMSGHDFERFVLKVMCAHHFGDMLTFDGKNPNAPVNEAVIVDALIRNQWRPGTGLYYTSVPSFVDKARDPLKSWQAQPAYFDGALVGFSLVLNQFPFFLSIDPLVRPNTDQYSYRPAGLLFEGSESRSRGVAFSWLPDAGGEDPVLIRRAGDMPLMDRAARRRLDRIQRKQRRADTKR